MGGALRGSQIHGTFPNGFTSATEYLGRGRLVPTTPWEGLWNAVSRNILDRDTSILLR